MRVQRTNCNVGRWVTVFAATPILLLSCGYKPVNTTASADNGAVVIPTVLNHTAFSAATSPLTASLRRRAAEHGIRVESSDPRATILKTEIVAVHSDAGMLKADDKRLYPLDSILRIEVTAHLEDASGKVIVPKERFKAQGRSLVHGSPDLEETRSQERRTSLLDDLADMIVSYFFIAR